MIFDFLKTTVLFVVLAIAVFVSTQTYPWSIFLFLSALLVVAIWAVFWEPNQLVVKHYVVDLPSLPSDWNGLKIGMIGCLHAGSPFVNREKVKRVASLLNEQQPDYVFMLGDLIASFVLGGKRFTSEEVAEDLKSIDCANKFAVLGNHDSEKTKSRSHFLQLELPCSIIVSRTVETFNSSASHSMATRKKM